MYQRNHNKMRFMIAAIAVVAMMLPICVFAGETEAVPYTVQHWIVDQNDAVSLALTEVDRTGAVGTEVAATPKAIEGYAYAEGYPGAVPSGYLTDGDTLTLKLYYQIDLAALAAAGAEENVPVSAKVPEPESAAVDAGAVEILDEGPPLAAPAEEIAGFSPVSSGFATTWAMYNLILTAVTVLVMVGVFVTSPYRRLWLRAVSAIVMFSAIGLYLVTENMMERMVLVDEYTVMHLVLAAAAGVIAFLSWNVFRLPEGNQGNTDRTV